MTRGGFGRTNPIKNPSFEVDTTGYLCAGTTTMSRVTSQSHVGTASLECVSTAASQFAMYGKTVAGVANAESIPVSVGQLVTFSAYGKMASGTVTSVARIYWFRANGSFISNVTGTNTSITDTDWTRLSVTGSAPTDATHFGVALDKTTSGAHTTYTDAWLAEKSPFADVYFDGDTTDDAYDHSWIGIPHASESKAVAVGVRTNLLTNPSVETNITDWTANVTIVRGSVTTYPFSGTYYMGGINWAESAKVPATAGLAYTGSCYFSRGGGARNGACTVHFYTVGGVELDPPTVTETIIYLQDKPQRFASSRVAPTGTTQVAVRGSGTTAAAIDAFLLEQSAYLDNYFDGGTVSNMFANAWTGTAHASTSTQSLATGVRYNLVPNPSFEATGTTGWTNTTRSSAATFPGANYSGGWVGDWNGAGDASKTVGIAVTVGLDYTASAWCTKVTASARDCAMSLHFFDSAGAEIDAPSTTLTALTTSNVPERRSHTRTAPAGAVTAQVWYERSGSLVAFDSVLLEQSSTVGDYFDGSWAPPGSATSWLGTAHNSASMLTTVATTQSIRVRSQESGGWNPKAAVPRTRVSGIWKVANPKYWNGSAWVELA